MTVRDQYQDQDPWFPDQGICQSIQDKIEALLCLETASRPRRWIRGNIPTGDWRIGLRLWMTHKPTSLQNEVNK